MTKWPQIPATGDVTAAVKVIVVCSTVNTNHTWIPTMFLVMHLAVRSICTQGSFFCSAVR